MSDPRIIFAGTPEFARHSLEALVGSGNAPVAVLTQPDRPAGRGKRVRKSAVKRCAEAQGIPVMQPRSLRGADTGQELAALEPDVLIVAAYGLLLPQCVLDIPRHGCLNVHASLLPRWRGAAPIQAAILAGDADTGISLMAMTAGLDSGPVYAQEKIRIGAAETAGELHDRLAVLGGRLLVRHLPAILDGSLVACEQDETLVTYAPRMQKSDAAMDWQLPATELERLVRAYNPVPGAYFEFAGERIKCFRAAVATAGAGMPAGTVIAADEHGIEVACGAGTLRLLSLQRPGRRPVNAREFANQLELRGQRLD